MRFFIHVSIATRGIIEGLKNRPAGAIKDRQPFIPLKKRMVFVGSAHGGVHGWGTKRNGGTRL